MTERDAVQLIEERRTKNHCFVKWWRNEEDFLDYELIDHFVENAGQGREIAGFEMLTMDEMWNELKRMGARVRLLEHPEGSKIEWLHEGRSGVSTKVCDYLPQSLMAIFDVETRGNPVDS
ncbi:hypothetical protein [Pelotalea chapellei]|uniref:Uncharacterized protein n=1 Tax=Pelotalea chapellei TaxID=44671 RepID=A0ABS5UCF7_9BACT|nr:hypothetical protein [Pelotalea chapellei]MBT1073341.1 hypothetical protein [Pelotalea chapellei]